MLKAHQSRRRRSQVYRRAGLVLDDHRHQLAVSRSRSSCRRKGADPGVVLLLVLAMALLVGWIGLVLLVGR